MGMLMTSLYAFRELSLQYTSVCMSVVCCSLPISQVERFGKPTWKRLVKAVEDKVGGNNPALAQTIARDHIYQSGTTCVKEHEFCIFGSQHIAQQIS